MRLGLHIGRPRRLRPLRLPSRDRLRKGIFLVPSTLTVGNMFCGFTSVLAALHGRLTLAAWLLLLAGVLDGLDGRVARLTHATSEFGKEYDSLADVVSFGLAPAFLVYQWRLVELGRWGLALAFLFLVAGSVRLARFNVQAETIDKRFFVGLPIPAGAAALTLAVLLDPSPATTRGVAALLGAYVLVVALLMVSTVPYRSFKDFSLHRRWPATLFFVLALVVVVLVTYREHAMAVLLGLYLLLGPAELVVRAILGRPVTRVGPNPPEVSLVHREDSDAT
jgi:CDP-diacylglycerol---serine O-phosphatidyltransferase